MVKKVRRYSTSLIVVLILTGAIGLGYFAKLFTGKKQIMLADTVAENPLPKKHKRKHRVKNHQPLIATVKTIDTPVKEDRVVAIMPEPVKPAPVIAKIISPDSAKVAIDHNTFLYTTYVQPNVTGVIKLRQQDKFYSDIIADIPANALVRVLKKGPMYYQVAYNNNIGYVPKWSLQTK